MMCLRSLISSHSDNFSFYAHLAVFALAVSALNCLAQNPSATENSNSSRSEAQTLPEPALPAQRSVTIPAGTKVALVLTHPIQSRYIRRGDDIYAQVTFPVESGNQVVIPPGTFVQGRVEKLRIKGGRGELHLQSAAITFPDGYVAPIEGPITLQTNEGYAVKDPGASRVMGVFALPAAGGGLGALIGHSVGKADSTVTSTFPPGCIGVPPFCSTTSTPVFGTKGKDAIIGAGIGSAIGAVASMTLLFSSKHFFIDAGAPAEMTLEHPVTLTEDEVAAAVPYSAEHPVPEQPTMPRPLPPPPPDIPVDHGTCYTPGTPGTPPTIIPGTPRPDGVPGPPTILPGTPPTPGTPYPCP